MPHWDLLPIFRKEGNWYKVNYNGTDAYVSANYFTEGASGSSPSIPTYEGYYPIYNEHITKLETEGLISNFMLGIKDSLVSTKKDIINIIKDPIGAIINTVKGVCFLSKAVYPWTEEYDALLQLGHDFINSFIDATSEGKARMVGKTIGDVLIAIVSTKGASAATKALKSGNMKNVFKAVKARDRVSIDDIVKGATKAVDDIFNNGKKVLDNFKIDTAYVKPKHLSTTKGKGQQFLGNNKVEAEIILKDAMKNGTVKSITDNGITKAGNASYEIIIDAGKEIGTRGETLVKIVLSEDGGMLSAYPIK